MMSDVKLFYVAAAVLAGLVPSFAQSRFVHADGKQLAGPDGKPLMLRGINLGNWLVPEGYMFHFDGGPLRVARSTRSSGT